MNKKPRGWKNNNYSEEAVLHTRINQKLYDDMLRFAGKHNMTKREVVEKAISVYLSKKNKLSFIKNLWVGSHAE